ncbi:hypothetical protein L5515_011168 [Caenorhabditis briggsae]|nr:hypothetical protein L3Y34_004048 [Caenorhabditis briggsae]UMM28244.1 hypothetical protein L5515_011168 [Caenorhabditis briggsae]
MDEMTRLFSPSCWVPGKSRDEVMNEFFAGIMEAYDSLMSNNTIQKDLDIPYGPDENQKVDVYGDVQDNLLIFFHGGYWVEGDRKYCLTPVPATLDGGFAFASLGYGLATNGRTLSDCVSDAVKGVEFLLQKYPNASNIHIGGHSAGAHLAFQAAVKVHSPSIKGLLLFAGVYFLEELVGTEIGNAINLTIDQAKLNSCDPTLLDGMFLRKSVFVGGLEAPKLIVQNVEFVKGRRGILKQFPLLSHYTLMTQMWNDYSMIKFGLGVE